MKKIEILVVEDEPKLAQTISDFLRIQNYEVETALTGNKALEYFCQNKQKVDLILLDLMLPDISGYTVLKEIRKISEVPVIILSAIGSPLLWNSQALNGTPDERIRERCG